MMLSYLNANVWQSILALVYQLFFYQNNIHFTEHSGDIMINDPYLNAQWQHLKIEILFKLPVKTHHFVYVLNKLLYW